LQEQKLAKQSQGLIHDQKTFLSATNKLSRYLTKC
jgi:hypothetical protein